MGRLKVSRKIVLKNAKSLAMPLLVSVLVILIFHLSFSSKDELKFENQARSNNIPVGIESIDGYQQVYYEFNGKKYFITEGNVNHTNPIVNEEFVAWTELINGSSQMARYNLIDRTTLPITHVSNNLKPTIYKSRLAWERSVDNKPQIFYFDGVKTTQMSTGDPSVRPALSEDYIAYARQKDGKDWYVVTINLADGIEKVVASGEDNAWPFFENGSLTTSLDDYYKYGRGVN